MDNVFLSTYNWQIQCHGFLNILAVRGWKYGKIMRRNEIDIGVLEFLKIKTLLLAQVLIASRTLRFIKHINSFMREKRLSTRSTVMVLI